MKNIRTIYKWLGSLFAMCILIFIMLGCKEMVSKAKGRIINQQSAPRVGLINGEMDYGYDVKVTIKNVGEAGVIRITPTLSTSEGEWKRSQVVSFAPDEEKTLTYFFHEPTVNVDNVDYEIDVFPEEK